MKAAKTPGQDHVRRSRTLMAAFGAGLPLAAALLGVVLYGPLSGTALKRYVEHRVEQVEVLLFCCAMGALGAKMLHNVSERRACRAAVLPAWDGQAVAVTEARTLLATLGRLPARLQNTYLVQRVAGVLDFLCQRGSADDLDDQLRALADNDQIGMENSYSLTRFITWAIPILGFLGTVLGITEAISGVDPNKLANDISQVTDGLAFAFDATALGLALTMVTMFVSFLVERQEQGVLEEVDRYIDRHLAHRFQRLAGDSGPFVEIVRQSTHALLEATQHLVERQAELWARTLGESEQRAVQSQGRVQERVAAAVEAALERTLTTQAQRLAALETQAVEQSGKLFEQLGVVATALRDTSRDQQAVLYRIGEGIAAQAGALTRLQEGEKELLHLQGALHQNLAALAGTGAFEQAVHSLTAAIHLLTARSGAVAAAAPPASRPQAGKAA
jgi:biopolymer transport protein ExbB/TolQ